MTKEELQALYKAHILSENKHPYHFEVKNNTSISLEAYNPMCGDKFHLYLDVNDNRFNDVHFHGIGCAVSKASTSILLKKIEGLSKYEAKDLCNKFVKTLTGRSDTDSLDKELDILVELKNFDGRVDCVKLAWETLLEHLNKYK